MVQGFRLADVYDALTSERCYKKAYSHKEALNRGITNAVYTNTLMLELGAELHFSLGSNKNIKITTLEDIDIFKALYSTKRDAWLRSKKETK